MCVVEKSEGRLVGWVVGVEGGCLAGSRGWARQVWEGYESGPR